MPAQYPTLAAAAGTTISITTTAPASHDRAGFNAVVDATTAGDASTGWVEVGYITDAGGMPKTMRDFKDVELLSGTTVVLPTSEKMDSFEVTAVHQHTDAGQIAVESIADGETVVWFKWQLPSGFKRFAAAYVTGCAPSVSGPNDEVTANFTVKPLFDAEGAGAVSSAP